MFINFHAPTSWKTINIAAKVPNIRPSDLLEVIDLRGHELLIVCGQKYENYSVFKFNENMNECAELKLKQKEFYLNGVVMLNGGYNAINYKAKLAPVIDKWHHLMEDDPICFEKSIDASNCVWTRIFGWYGDDENHFYWDGLE